MKKIFCILVLLLSVHTGWAAEPLRIGFIGPMTGMFADASKEATQVLTLLAADINDQGGVAGRKVELFFEDDGSNPEAAVAAAKKLLLRNPVAVIGTQTSTITEALQPVFNDRKVIHISHAATAMRLTEKGYKYFFRTCPQNNDQAKAVIKSIRKMNIKKAALIHDGSLYGQDLADAVRKGLYSWMIDVVYDGQLTIGPPDYLSLVEKVKAAGPELVFFAGYYPEAAKLLSARSRLNWTAVFMSGDGAHNSDLVEIAGKKAAAGFYFISPPAPEDISFPRTKAFFDRYQKAYGAKPSSIFALFAGDALIAVLEGIAKMRSTDPDLISDYLHRSYFNTGALTGKQYFNYKGDVMNDLHGLYRVDNEGRFVLQTVHAGGQAAR